MPSFKKDTVQRAAEILLALNNPFRQKILDLIGKNPGENITQVRKRLRMEQSAVSLHLGILRRAGFIISTANGQSRHYSVNNKRITQVQEKIERINEIFEINK